MGAESSIFCFVYNEFDEAFTMKYLNYASLREKILSLNYNELVFLELNRFSDERCGIGVFQKGN